MKTYLPERAGIGSVLLGMGALVALLVLVAFAAPVYAQEGALPPKAPTDLAVADVTLETLSTYDLSAMNAQWWKNLAGEIDRDLATSGADSETAMRKSIFLATYYPDKVDLRGSATELYNIYRFNKREEQRVMALAALYAIGDDSAMRLLAWHAPFANYAPWEDSDIVRRMTMAAVAAYYRTPQVIVEPPTVIGANPPQEQE